MTIQVNDMIGRYRLIQWLGQGGMASVYKAFDIRLERYVAIKVILATAENTGNYLKRFEREAKALAQLSHHHIVKVLDYGEHDGAPYLVMEYVPGGTMKDRMGVAVPFSEAAATLVPVGQALEYAHKHHIVHRDVKPANILISESGQPMLSDFGIAKREAGEVTTDLTATGAAIGTPDYMAPEQGMGQTVDGRADVYSLGIIFYELVTGKKPYTADTPMALVLKHATQPMPSPRQFVPGLPEKVEAVLSRALAKKPENRYASMEDFTAALEDLAQMKTSGSLRDKFIGRSSLKGTAKMQEPLLPYTSEITAVSQKQDTPRKLLRWGLQLIITLAVGLSIVALALLWGSSYVISSVMQNAAKNGAFYSFQKTETQTLTEQEVRDSIINSIQPYTGDWLKDAQVDFKYPDQVWLNLKTSSGTYDVLMKVKAYNNVPQFSLVKINNTQMFIIGGIISSGVNRGFLQGLTSVKTRVSDISIDENKLSYTVGPME
jgi:serine/threonine protein kinase